MKRLIPLVLILALVLVIGAAGIAFAYFQLQGEGKAVATSARRLPPRVTSSGDLSGLYPGSSRTLRVTVQNPNPYPITLSKIDAYSKATKSGCPAFAVKSEPVAMKDASTRLIPGQSRSYSVTLGLQTWADDTCAGQKFDIDVRVYAASAQ